MWDTVGRSTVLRHGRPAAHWTLLVPWAAVAALLPTLLGWIPGFTASDTTAAVIASAVTAFVAVAIVSLTSFTAKSSSDSAGDELLFIAALASAGAAAIHFSVIRMHFDEYTLYGVFFVLSGIAQLVWPIWLLLRRWEPLLILGAIGNAAIVALWILDRVGAMPIGPDAKDPSPFGLGDGIASGFEVLLVVTCLVALVRGRGRALGARANLALTFGAAGLTTLALLSVLGAASSVLPPAM
ncbi:MAG TPA: hypothetical protein VJ838_07100 [Gaiellaceae bacterium]|nr:hypothetical protein [Gaiellaceae bacterium]